MHHASPTTMNSCEDSPAAWPGPREFLERLIELRAECRLQGEPLSVVTIDVDRFHECNELHSPAFGDRVLEQIAAAAAGVCGVRDIWARYATDRFVLGLHATTETQAKAVVRRLLQALCYDPVRVNDCVYPTNVSCGIAASQSGSLETEHQLIKRSGTALQYAQRQGG